MSEPSVAKVPKYWRRVLQSDLSQLSKMALKVKVYFSCMQARVDSIAVSLFVNNETAMLSRLGFHVSMFPCCEDF